MALQFLAHSPRDFRAQGWQVAGSSNEVQWQQVRQLTAASQMAAARAILEDMLVREPGDIAARLYLAGLLGAQDHQRAAVAQTLEAARFAPRDPQVLGDMVAALIWVGELVAARQLLDSPLIESSTVPAVLMRAAGQRQAIGDNALALELMQRARTHGATGPGFLFHHAVQLGFNGRLEEARAGLEACIRLSPPVGGAFVELARMGGLDPEHNHVDRIVQAIGRVAPGGFDHAALEFALFQELHDLRRHAEAWEALSRGNAVMRGHFPHDPAREAALFAAMIRLTTANFVRPQANTADTGPQPVFVVGLPRSGTTLLERMLGNHSQIASAGELGDFPRSLFLVSDHLPRGMFDETSLGRLPTLDWTQVGQTYLAQTRWRAAGKRFFVDKLPRNWMVAGLIHMALPSAKILHVVRDPMDVCFSNWRAFFGRGSEYAYAYDLDALASHHAQYRALLAHWHTIAPGRIHDVDYESLVHRPESTLRGILAFCGLEYEEGCTDPARNTSPSATLSMSQVRQGIRTDTAAAWRPYATQLAGLRAALGQAARDA
jgi:hypothetical protein